MNTEIKPFKTLFEKLRPEQFARLFAHEARQTRVYLLSFAPDAAYVKAVIAQYHDSEFTALAADYLNQVESQPVDTAFVRRVEGYIEDSIAESQSWSAGLRKNFNIDL
jgi:hypothetical protein